MNDQPVPDDVARAFEREKWEAQERRLDRIESADKLKVQNDFELRERELQFKMVESRRARLWNPLAIAILGAAVAAGGNAYAWVRGA